jgi:hypothetical protein
MVHSLSDSSILSLLWLMKMIISPLLSYICVINLLLISIIGYQLPFVNP